MTKPRVVHNKDFYKRNNFHKSKEINFNITATERLTTKEDFLFCSDTQKRAKLRIVEYCKTKPKSWSEVKMVIDL